LDRRCWTTTVELPAWVDFLDRSGPYGSQGSGNHSKGTVKIVFAPEGRDDSPLQDREVELVRWAIEHAEDMQRSLLEALLEEYPNLELKYGVFVDEELLPEVSTAEDIRPLIGLHALHVHPVEKDGLPYVGFELGCTWDDEHGLGVLMHGPRVVDIGGADTAFLLWIARRDAGGVA
jgi:hypothetical protein